MADIPISTKLISSTKYARPYRWIGIGLESIFALVIIITLLRVMFFLHSAGYLPRPFFYNSDDDFMDWYNTAIYAFNSGAYDRWNAIYPPFSFLFLRVFSDSSCYAVTDANFARSCDVLSRLSLCLFYVINVYLVFKAYSKADKNTSIQRTVGVALGLPMLYAFDRGNLIIPCFACFAAGYSGILRSARLRWLAIAVAVNFKPYLVISILPALLKRRWRWVEGCAIFTILIFAGSYAIYGSGSPEEIIKNIVGFTAKKEDSLFDAAFYASSYSAIIALLKSQFPMMHFIGSRLVDGGLVVLPSLQMIGQLAIVTALLVASIKPKCVPWYRLTAFGVALILGTEGAGGYAQVFFLFLVFFERWDRSESIFAIICAYILSWPADITVYNIAHQVGNSYLTSRTVGVDFGISVGELLRPGILILLEVALAVATFRDVLKGWSADRHALARLSAGNGRALAATVE